MIIELLKAAREVVAQLIDREPTMLLYDLGYTEERSDEALLQDDLSAIFERAERIGKENTDFIYSVVDDIMDHYGFGSLNVEPYRIPLLGKGEPTSWLCSSDPQIIYPTGKKFEWVPWEDRDGVGVNTYGIGVPTEGYARWMTTECHYCKCRHDFYSELPFSQAFYKELLEKDGWVKNPAGYFICPVCWIGLFID